MAAETDRFIVLRAVAEGRVTWVPLSAQHSAAIMKRIGGRGPRDDVTVTANWLRSRKLIALPYTGRGQGVGRVARPLLLTKAGREALDIAEAVGQGES